MAPPDSQSDPLDGQALDELRALGGDQLVARVVKLYLDSSQPLMAAAQDALKANDSEALRQAAHALKSSSANVGAAELTKLCQQVEFGARDSAPATTATAFATLTREYARVRHALERHLRTTSAA